MPHMRTKLTRTPCPSRLCAKLTRPSPVPTSPHPNTWNRQFYPITPLLLGQLRTTTPKKHRDKSSFPLALTVMTLGPEPAISACTKTTFLEMLRSKPAPCWHTDAKGVILILNYISQISHGVFLPSPALRTRRPAGGPQACADVSRRDRRTRWDRCRGNRWRRHTLEFGLPDL